MIAHRSKDTNVPGLQIATLVQKKAFVQMDVRMAKTETEVSEEKPHQHADTHEGRSIPIPSASTSKGDMRKDSPNICSKGHI